MSTRAYAAAVLVCAVALAGCASKRARSRPGRATPKCVESKFEVPPTPPPEPTGKDCLTDKAVQNLLRQLSKGKDRPEDARLVSAECRKRVYKANGARYVFWDTADEVRGKRSTSTCALPTPRCIERALAQAQVYAPFARAILDGEAKRSPELWRDPDVGAVSFLQCDAAEQPAFKSIATMLHETNHRLSPDRCLFDFESGGELCFTLPRGLPEGTIAAYPRPPRQLDRDGAEWFAHVQQTYLFNNEHGLREMLEEVMSYSITSRMLAVGAERGIYPAPGKSTYNNLPLLMALTARYLRELAKRDPALAQSEFGPKGRNRRSLDAVLAQGEDAYRVWLKAVRSPGVFERTAWEEYQRARSEWLAAMPR